MSDDADEFDDIMAGGSVQPLFQPIVDLDSGVAAGFEAVTRGPAGRLHEPGALFAAARRSGRLPELDWLCRAKAVDAARAAGVRSPLSLLINAEPETLLADRADPSRWGEFADLRCYCEITERAIAATPGRLAAAIDQIRAQDWGVALDDVGADPASLALLPLLQPDLIKLDLRLLHEKPVAPGDVRVARVVDAALAQAASTGAAVIAEGIETEWHLELARAYGVQFGQGFLFGRPGALPQPLPEPRRSMPLVARVIDRAISPGPFAIVASATAVRSLSRQSVVELGRQLLAQAGTLVPEPSVLICSPHPLAPELMQLLTGLSQQPTSIPLVGVLGVAQPPLAVTALRPDDPAARDFAITVITAHFAAALVARESAARSDRYDAVLVLDRRLALAAANTMLTRL